MDRQRTRFVAAPTGETDAAGWATLQLKSAARVLEMKLPRECSVPFIGLVSLHDDGTPELRAFCLDMGVEDPVRDRHWRCA